MKKSWEEENFRKYFVLTSEIIPHQRYGKIGNEMKTEIDRILLCGEIKNDISGYPYLVVSSGVY